MLVYYLKEKTLVGRTGSKQDPDIQLSGVGIQDEHCEINVDPDDWTVTLVPYAGSRTCINGVEVSVPTLLRNGDRIFWGSNHFFRINCPKTTNNPSDPGNFFQMATYKLIPEIFYTFSFFLELIYVGKNSDNYSPKIHS